MDDTSITCRSWSTSWGISSSGVAAAIAAGSIQAFRYFAALVAKAPNKDDAKAYIKRLRIAYGWTPPPETNREKLKRLIWKRVFDLFERRTEKRTIEDDDADARAKEKRDNVRVSPSPPSPSPSPTSMEMEEMEEEKTADELDPDATPGKRQKK